MADLIDRQAAIDLIMGQPPEPHYPSWYAEQIKGLASAQPERDIPLKPIADFDRSWGIPRRQAVCPKCDYFLGNWSFFGDGKRITYCETCGQAIDWEGWENETEPT